MSALHVHHEVALLDGGPLALTAWRNGWTPPPILTLSQWADNTRKLPREASAEPGDWHTSRTPYLRAIMDDLSVHSPVTEVTFLKSTQVGGSEVGINLIGYVIDHAPGPGMYVMPTIPVAREFSDERIQPAVDLMPSLRKKIGKRRSRDSGNTALKKKFPAGFWVFSGANSSSSLASKPIRFLVLDELSKYPRDLDEQGSAQTQAVRRTSTFTRRKKILRISSPTIADACAITEEYEKGTQGEYHVPCPHCMQLQVLDIEQLTDDGQFLCLHCGKLIDERHKTWMLREAGHSDGGLAEWVHAYPERAMHSYRIWAAYSADGLGYTWKEIADMRREAKDDPEKEVTFFNTILGKAYQGASERVEWAEVKQRAGKWVRRTVPRGCLLLVAVVDVQANRFSVAIVGFGRDERCWPIDWVELPGDPTRKEDWSVVDDYLAQPIVNSCGVQMRPVVTGIDSGNWTNEVYAFVRPRQTFGVVALKGANTLGAPVIAKPKKQESNKRGKDDRHGVRRWMVGVNTVKTTLMRRLVGDAKHEPERQLFQFPADHSDEFYQQLTAERFDLTAQRWVKPSGARNEVLDLMVYAYAVACLPTVRIHVMRDADWAALEARLEPPTGDMFSAPAPAAPAAEQPQRMAEKKQGPEKGPSAPSPVPAQPPAAPARGSRGFGSEGWGFGSRN